MARDHARIFTAIWSDPDFRAMPVPPQHAFFMLLSQPRLSYCGVMDYLPNRLAKMSAKSTARTITSSIAALEAARFVVTDDDTGELLIRSFVRHDGLLAMPNMTKAMTKDYLAVLSDPLRDAITAELRRAFTETPDLGGWKGLAKASPDLYLNVTAKGSPKGSVNG